MVQTTNDTKLCIDDWTKTKRVVIDLISDFCIASFDLNDSENQGKTNGTLHHSTAQHSTSQYGFDV